MIYINKEAVQESEFTTWLENTKIQLLDRYSSEIPKAISGHAFETEVYNQMLLGASGTNFAGCIQQTGMYAFPDIVAKQRYGVEVKMTVSDKWLSTGNSIMESTRIDSVETIYLLFGKFGNLFDVKYRKYQDCLYDVGVTHSPRYKIDMNLQAGQSIFDKLNTEYDVFRKEKNPVKRLKTHYRKQLKPGEELWWMEDTTDQPPVSPIISSFRQLDWAVREQFITECFILFPEIYGKSTTKFERAAVYLITHYNGGMFKFERSFHSRWSDEFNCAGKEHYHFETILSSLYQSRTNIGNFAANAKRKAGVLLEL